MKVKGIAHCALNSDPALPSSYQIWATDMSDYGYIKIHEVEFDVTPLTQEEYVRGAVGELKNKQQKIRAQAESQVNTLQEQINNLLCLVHNPEVAEGERVLQEPTGNHVFYVTYGNQYVQANSYSVVKANDYDEARAWVEHICGSHFAFMYDEDRYEDAIARYGLTEIPLQPQCHTFDPF